MLPGVDGYDIMSYIRPMDIPVIFITARHEVKDRVKGLRLGADDYLVKPFDVVELVARVEAVLRRYNKTERLLTAGDVTVDVEARRVTRAGRNVELTNKEFGLLVLFIQNKNVALFRETLYEKVWEGEYSGDSRTLDLHMQVQGAAVPAVFPFPYLFIKGFPEKGNILIPYEEHQKAEFLVGQHHWPAGLGNQPRLHIHGHIP